MRRPSLALAHLPFAALLAGCPVIDEPAGGPPCEDDLTACSDDTSKFVEDPSCELSGDLELQLGEGEDSFSALEQGQSPHIYTGFQGGSHVWLGLRVVNADLERPLLKVRVLMETCEADCVNQSNWQIDNVRELVADSSTLTTTSEGWYELSSVLVQVYGWSSTLNSRIQVLVTDPCSRQGVIFHEVSGG